MTKEREALNLALEALEKCDAALAEELAAWDIDPPLHHVLDASNACGPAITALRERLAQPEQEPVAWRWLYDGKPEGEQCFSMPGPDADVVARAAACEFPRTVQYLYTAPQPTQEHGHG